MYTIKFLAPALLMLCGESAVHNQGYCAVDQHKLNVVKYYEPGKSCYVNGVFYTKCEDRLNGPK